MGWGEECFIEMKELRFATYNLYRVHCFGNHDLGIPCSIGTIIIPKMIHHYPRARAEYLMNGFTITVASVEQGLYVVDCIKHQLGSQLKAKRRR